MSPTYDDCSSMIKALQNELKSPSIAAFIDAADVTLNSNTYVMRFDLGHVVAQSDYAEAFLRLLQSELFRDAMYEGDVGYWDNYHTVDVVGGEVQYTRRAGNFLVPNPGIVCAPLTRYAFVDRLVCLLSTRRGSWYRSQLPTRHARGIVGRFLGALFGIADSSRFRGCAHRKELVALIPSDVELIRVKPNFMSSTGYFDVMDSDLAPESTDGSGQLAYFDGGPNDTCTAIVYQTTCTILLTNGSP